MLRNSVCFVLLFSGIVGATVFSSCNNASNNTTGAETKNATGSQGAISSDSLTREADLNFVDACVENSKASLGEAKAYAHCKCMLDGIKQTYGNADSATVIKLQTDTAAMAKILQRCQ